MCGYKICGCKICKNKHGIKINQTTEMCNKIKYHPTD